MRPVLKDNYRPMHWSIFVKASKAFWDESTSRYASSLTISTLLAMVPMMAIALALIQMLPALSGVIEQLQDLIFANFVPKTSQAIKTELDTFAQQTVELTTVGIAFLFVTAIMLLINLELSINHIWHYGADSHPWWQRLLKHLAIIVLFPLLIGLSFALSSFLLENLGQFKQVLMPTIATYFGFLLLYKIVPNGHVPIVPALWGALVGSVLFEGMKQLFRFYLAYFHAYEIVYGALSVIPILLLWLYLSWIIVLFCCMITREMTIREGEQA
jgi:membrane protein